MTPLKRQLTNTTSLWGTAPREAVTAAVITAVGATSTAAVAAVTIAMNIVYSVVTSFVVAALTPKPEIPESQGLLVNIRDAVAPQEFVYGQVRKGGTITYVETTGDKNKLLHQIIAIAGHEVGEIGDIYINDEVVSITDDTGYRPNGTDVALDGPGWVTTTKWTAKNRINSSENPYQGQKIRWPKIRLLKHDGSQTSVTDTFAGSSTATLSNTFLTETDNFDGTGQPTSTSFVGNGIAYLYARLGFQENVFSGGIPLITAVVKGKKVYDPRTSTTAYSNNAALVIRDYLTSAYGLNDDEIDDTYFSTAADICDENVALDGGGTEKRYTINGVVRASTSHQEVLTKMMSACGGTLFWGGGKWKLIVGDYTAPTKTLTLDDLRSPINLDTRVNLRNQFNKVQGTFNSAADDWITTDYPPITSAAFVAQDGGEETPLDLSLPFTTSASAAQRLAKQTLFRAREQMTFSAEFGLNALDVEVGEIISLDIDRYGWSGKEFEVVGWALRPNQQAGDLRVSLTLRETSEAAFDWNAEETAIITNNTTLPDFTTVPTITGLTVSNGGGIQADGTTLTTALVSWDAAGDPVEYYEVLYKPLTTEVAAGSFVIGDEYQIKTVGTTDFTAFGAASNTVGLFFRATGVGSGTGVAYDAENNFSVVTANSGDDLIASGTISVEIGPLIGGTLYYVKVRAIDSFGNIATDFTTTTFTAGQDTVAPGLPTSVTASGGFEYIRLNWVNPTDADFSYVEVWESEDTLFSNASKIAVATGDTFVRTNLGINVTRHYWLRAFDYTGNGSVDGSNNPIYTARVQATTDFVDSTEFVNDVVSLFADQGLYAIEDVTGLPVSGDFTGQKVFNRNDGKLYEWNGSAWVLVIADVAAGSITETKIANDAITTPKLAAGAVTAFEIAGNTITGDKIVANTITGGLLATSGIITDSAQINNAVIENANIANLAVDTIKVANDAITRHEYVNYSLLSTSSQTYNFSVDMDFAGQLSVIAFVVSFGSGTSTSITFTNTIDFTTGSNIEINGYNASGSSQGLGDHTLTNSIEVVDFQTGTYDVETVVTTTGITSPQQRLTLLIMKRYK